MMRRWLLAQKGIRQTMLPLQRCTRHASRAGQAALNAFWPVRVVTQMWKEQAVPPLELVLRTRWPAAQVDWNGSDPIM